MEELTRVTTYQQYKQAMDTELRRTTEGFVRIGYLLKMARDTDILRESGYSSVVEFAQKEYNIDKTQVSRFIHINDRFSEGGYSDRLLEKYQDFGYAKLTIMLTLPDELNEVLTPDYSKAEIQTLKEEYDAEQKITDLEVMMEGQEPTQAAMDSTIAKALHQLFKDNPEKYVEVHKTIGGGLAAVMEALAPSGAMIYNVRLQGIGRIAISLHEDYDTLDLVNLRDGELEKVPWTEVMETLKNMINTLQEPEFNWEQIYGEAFPVKQPEKPEVAPVQQEKPAEKPAPRKESKVVKAKEPKPEPKPEEQLPRQMDITEFKEALPESVETETEPEVIAEEDIEVVEEPESRIPTLAEAVQGEDKKKTIAGLKAGITSALHNIPRYMAAGNWAKIGEMLMDAKWRVDKIQELEGK
ncbi:MAG: hypothetical protein IJ420_06105 [Lachnospiraceae bacterium]|nr:hypothetical protein [Lachnospiraceae bacterium]